jgi:hypothetical protein
MFSAFYKFKSFIPLFSTDPSICLFFTISTTIVVAELIAAAVIISMEVEVVVHTFSTPSTRQYISF